MHRCCRPTSDTDEVFKSSSSLKSLASLHLFQVLYTHIRIYLDILQIICTCVQKQLLC